MLIKLYFIHLSKQTISMFLLLTHSTVDKTDLKTRLSFTHLETKMDFTLPLIMMAVLLQLSTKMLSLISHSLSGNSMSFSSTKFSTNQFSVRCLRGGLLAAGSAVFFSSAFKMEGLLGTSCTGLFFISGVTFFKSISSL